MIIGYHRQLQLLDLHVRKGTLSHAYLFTGPRHVGKLTIARCAAASILCEKKTDAPGNLFSCGECNSCKMCAAGAHPDMYMVDTEETREQFLRLEDIQRVRERAYMSAYGGTHVFLIRDVSRMTREAANAFLKVLEEPRGCVIFFLLASAADDVLETIRSRSWHICFWPMSEKSIRTGLAALYKIPREASESAAQIADGLIGRAIQFIRAADKERKARKEEHQFINSLLRGSAAERLRYADTLRENTDGMRAWFSKSTACAAGLVHASLQDGADHAVVFADMCRALIKGEERFLKPYGTKRILFEDTLVSLSHVGHK